MSEGSVLLVGLLAEPAMRSALGLAAGGRVTLPGRLSGGARAGISAEGWPVLDAVAPSRIAAVRVGWTPALDRYAEVMGLAPLPTPEGPVLGVTPPNDATGRVEAPTSAPPADRDPATPAEDGAAHDHLVLAARIAADLAAAPAHQTPAALRARLPMIAWWAASRLRAKAERGTPALPGPMPQDGGPRVVIEAREEPYAAYFAVESLRLRHRLHGGGWSAPMDRAVFVSGDAVVVLPWDPVRDRVLLIDQFRVGPAARGDAQPWLLEPVAGRIDAGETPETTARREALEEAGLTIDRLIPVPGHYPTPGIVAEYLYGFIGLADLPDDAAGLHGLESEGEDIRGHLLPRAELTEMALDGRIVNGPLMILALWLDRMADRLGDAAGV